MASDFWIVLQWWGTLFFVGAIAFPLTKLLFAAWFDRGYLFAKAVGMAIVTYLVYLLGVLRVAPFEREVVFAAMAIVFIFGLILNKSFKLPRSLKWKTILTEEIFFFAALLFWAWVKGHEPSIRGLEKFMDYGFMKSILESAWFPAPDMWYSGFPINYYYFGHTAVALLTKLSGIDLSFTFNLTLATLFALTLTMSFSIGRQLIGEIRGIGAIGGGIFTAFLVTLAGNMQTLYAFTKGYTGEDVQPFWRLLWPIGEFFSRVPEGLERYWYANATRFIPFTIHEFPSYSFVVSDVHGHVLSLPFTLLAIALLIHMVSLWDKPHSAEASRGRGEWASYVFYGLLVAILLMTNALDGPIYLGLFFVTFVAIRWKTLRAWERWIPFMVVVIAAGFASLPFLSHFRSFVNGLAVNCPPAFLADKKIGFLLFETVDKCQRSPLWMLWLLWGFFWFCGAWLVAKFVKLGKLDRSDKLLLLFFVFSTLLIIFPELFYFKDIYPAHFRSNTMFKLGYQAFIMFSIVAGYTIVKIINSRVTGYSPRWGGVRGKKVFILLLIPQLFLVSIYPIFSVRSYFNSLRQYQGLAGLTWFANEYPDDYAAVRWLNTITKCPTRLPDGQTPHATCDRPVIVEADGDSYTDYGRISAFTGLPAVIGWPVHEWLWRGTYDVVAPRRDDVRIIYESQDLAETMAVLSRYGVTYVVVGDFERDKFAALDEGKLQAIGREVFSQGTTTIYEVVLDTSDVAPQSADPIGVDPVYTGMSRTR